MIVFVFKEVLGHKGIMKEFIKRVYRRCSIDTTRVGSFKSQARIDFL